MQISAVEIPSLAGQTEFAISAILVEDGQAVQQGQILAHLDSSGGGHQLISPQAGYVVGLRAAPGAAVHAGQILCYICPRPSIPASQTGILAEANNPTGIDASTVILFGGGGHGKITIDLIRAMGTYRILGIIDDGLPAGSSVMGVPVLGGAKDLPELYRRGVRLAVNTVGGIGNVAARLKIFEILEESGFICPALIHPSAVVERSAWVDAGVQIFAHAYVGSEARIGFGSVINTAGIVHHDCVLGKVVNISPGATLAGSVIVEDHAQIGMLATVNVKVTVGAGALLGNGCTVKADVPPGMRVRAGAIWPEPRQKPPQD
ncbi:MAG: biotin/lipoyl-binding protein [Chloroflexi bacterium]|nr:biotin/lipoyl-binding protein [Chloroflexota bacterium]